MGQKAQWGMLHMRQRRSRMQEEQDATCGLVLTPWPHAG